MKINIIAAVAKNGVIGSQGKLPWNIPEDLKRFKELTLGNAVIMGRLTWQSLPIKPLPRRENFVISSSSNYHLISGDNFIARSSVASALNTCNVLSNIKEVFIIGGNRIYKEALDLNCVDSMYITHVHNKYDGSSVIKEQEGDTYFPEIDFSKWKEVEREDFEGYSFVKYYRLRNA